jgi:hypothetical protein
MEEASSTVRNSEGHVLIRFSFTNKIKDEIGRTSSMKKKRQEMHMKA